MTMFDSAGTVLEPGDYVRVSLRAMYDRRPFDVGSVSKEDGGKPAIFWSRAGCTCAGDATEEPIAVTRITEESYSVGRAGYRAGFDAGYERAIEQAGPDAKRMQVVMAAVDTTDPEILDKAIGVLAYTYDPEDEDDDEPAGDKELVDAIAG
jgi:hypothetical protein